MPNNNPIKVIKDAQADFLITGDQDLLILQMIGETEIVTYRDFLSKIAIA